MDALTVDVAVARRRFIVDAAFEARDEPLAIAGPSGSGKSTILRAIAGFVTPLRGRIALGDTVLYENARVDVPPERRNIGLVFQERGLFPHRTVRQNVEFAATGDVSEVLGAFGLESLANARPPELSGGEQQRVALARVVASRPKALLLDEPLSGLDAESRHRLRGELARTIRELSVPTIVVTHDYEDAAALAPRIAIMHEGRIVQCAASAELVATPVDPFVARFTGANVLRARAARGANGLGIATLEDGTRVYSTDVVEGFAAVVVHPWDVSVARERGTQDSALNAIEGPITSLAHSGNRVRITIGGVTAEITAASCERMNLHIGEAAVMTFKATATRFLSVDDTSRNPDRAQS